MANSSKKSLHGFRTVPPSILQHIQELDDSSSFQIGFRRKLAKNQVRQGALTHAGVSLVDGNISYEESFLPQPNKRWARYNVYGLTKVRRDLPKHPVSWSLTTPIYGDGARNGYSTQIRSVMAYRKEVLHGKGYRVLVSHENADDDSFIITFVFDAVFPADVEHNNPDLLMAVSLIGETVGYPQVLDPEQSASEWAAMQSIDWDLLPEEHGTSLPEFDVVSKRFTDRTGRPIPDTYRERYEAMKKLTPKAIYIGTSGFNRYMAFVFAGVTVLENFSYGNAAYVMFDDWKILSQRTRPDLLSDPTANFIRIIHNHGWEKRIAAEVRRARL